jgi:hypothetical protein
MVLGGLNMPKAPEVDAIFDALTKLGLEVPEHKTQIASSVMSDAQHDKIAFFLGTTKQCCAGKKGVFNYDHVVFGDCMGMGRGRS